MNEVRTIQMQTNFHGLIHLLADGLYSTSDIFLRELVQNGHDGIIRRQSEGERGYQGAISITYSTAERSISIEDNGIGMDMKDIEEFLSVIGSTGTGTKRAELESKFSDELIGQFGIGLLSAFLVANRVRVHTRKLGSDEAFEWINTGSTDCQVRKIEKETVGSIVTVYLRNDFTYLLERKKLEEIVIRYCDFIAVPITINGTGPVNAIFAPWDKPYNDEEQRRDQYSSFVNRRFSDATLDTFSVKIEKDVGKNTFRANGVLYISDRRIAGINTVGSLDIFVRKMLVKEGDTTLLPTWAKFIRGVIDSPDLKPTAGRDNVNQDSLAFRVIQEELGRIIVERLAYLAKNLPEKFAYINHWHHDTLKGMAMANNSFFDMVGELLLFETNQGQMSLAEYMPKNPFRDDGKAPIYFFSHYDSAAQYYRMADEKGICVINAGRRFDEELLNKYGKRHSNVELEKLDVLDKGLFFEELAPEWRRQFQDLEQYFSFRMNNVLMITATVSTKRFQPDIVPVVIVESKDSEDERELQELLNNPLIQMNFRGAFRGLQSRRRARPIQLTLNSNNELIKALAQNAADIREEDMAEILTMLYNNALLYSHRLDEKNMSIVHDGIVRLMARVVEYNDELNAIKRRVEEDRRNQQQNAQTVAPVTRPKHIQFFMITPFDESYRPVEQAVRQVLECKPFFFEVRLARDYYSNGNLVRNVRDHLEMAHGFVAEISELNPNVMMEVGGVLLSGDERPIFALCDSGMDRSRVPADFGDKLTFSYGKRSQSPEEIAEQFRSRLFVDGRIANGDLEKLHNGEHEHFLSRTLLSNLEDISLKQHQIESVCSRFHTIEALLNASEKERNVINMKPKMMSLLLDVLEEQLEIHDDE